MGHNIITLTSVRNYGDWPSNLTTDFPDESIFVDCSESTVKLMVLGNLLVELESSQARL